MRAGFLTARRCIALRPLGHSSLSGAVLGRQARAPARDLRYMECTISELAVGLST
jgi:hypothetical protein